MGIPGLWQLLAPVMRECSLMEVVMAEALRRQQIGVRPLIIGVDASPIMFAAQASVSNARRRGASWTITGSKAELNTLMTYLSQFAELPANFGFWFDNQTNRPSRKRNRRVGTQEHQLTRDFKELIQGYGFAVHDAPGEAEAELAYLNEAGMLDFIYTPDSDVFLFGATKVLRSSQDKENRDLIQLYTKEDMVHCEPERLSRAGILLLAVLAGGDYDMAGLPDCGIGTAYALAKSSLAVSLYNIARSGMADQDLANRLSSWRQDLRHELSTNQSGFMSSRRPHLAQNMPNSFPDVEALQHYACPLTSNLDQAVPIESGRRMQLPDTERLTRSMCRMFDSWDWGQVMNQLSLRILPGHFNRQMVDVECARRLHRSSGLGFEAVDGITRVDKSRANASSSFPYYRVRIWPISLSSIALRTFLDTKNTAIQPGDVIISESALISVPAPILIRAMPQHVNSFHQRHPDLPISKFWAELQRKIEVDKAVEMEGFAVISDPSAPASTQYRTWFDGEKEILEIL